MKPIIGNKFQIHVVVDVDPVVDSVFVEANEERPTITCRSGSVEVFECRPGCI